VTQAATEYGRERKGQQYQCDRQELPQTAVPVGRRSGLQGSASDAAVGQSVTKNPQGAVVDQRCARKSHARYQGHGGEKELSQTRLGGEAKETDQRRYKQDRTEGEPMSPRSVEVMGGGAAGCLGWMRKLGDKETSDKRNGEELKDRDLTDDNQSESGRVHFNLPF
jgi:hypothetical protein